MRVVIQRVSQASVTVNENKCAQIDKGLLVLVGIEANDGLDDIEWLTGKIVQLRIFNDSDGVMNLSVLDVEGEIIAVSQFTLFAKTKKGNRPSYIGAAKPEISIPLYERFVRVLSDKLGREVETGIFGEHMGVSLVNDGPVTILIDSKRRE